MWLYPKDHPSIPLKFGNQELTAAREARWLRIWLDPKISFNKQLAEIEKKATQNVCTTSMLWRCSVGNRNKEEKFDLIGR